MVGAIMLNDDALPFFAPSHLHAYFYTLASRLFLANSCPTLLHSFFTSGLFLPPPFHSFNHADTPPYILISLPPAPPMSSLLPTCVLFPPPVHDLLLFLLLAFIPSPLSSRSRLWRFLPLLSARSVRPLLSHPVFSSVLPLARLVSSLLFYILSYYPLSSCLLLSSPLLSSPLTSTFLMPVLPFSFPSLLFPVLLFHLCLLSCLRWSSLALLHFPCPFLLSSRLFLSRPASSLLLPSEPPVYILLPGFPFLLFFSSLLCYFVSYLLFLPSPLFFLASPLLFLLVFSSPCRLLPCPSEPTLYARHLAQ